MLRITLRDGREVTDYKAGNLKGTCRTLDITAGIITLGDGVCSRDGVAVLDDSDTLAIKPDGTILPRENKESDIYYFAYGNNYIGATTDLISSQARYPLFPDMLFQTGGADIRPTPRKNISPLWINSRMPKFPSQLQLLIWTGTGLTSNQNSARTATSLPCTKTLWNMFMTCGQQAGPDTALTQTFSPTPTTSSESSRTITIT